MPPRMQLTEEEIQVQLDRRRPGQAGAGAISTGRNEADAVQILSGAGLHALRLLAVAGWHVPPRQVVPCVLTLRSLGLVRNGERLFGT